MTAARTGIRVRVRRPAALLALVLVVPALAAASAQGSKGTANYLSEAQQGVALVQTHWWNAKAMMAGRRIIARAYCDQDRGSTVSSERRCSSAVPLRSNVRSSDSVRTASAR